MPPPIYKPTMQIVDYAYLLSPRRRSVDEAELARLRDVVLRLRMAKNAGGERYDTALKNRDAPAPLVKILPEGRKHYISCLTDEAVQRLLRPTAWEHLLQDEGL